MTCPSCAGRLMSLDFAVNGEKVTFNLFTGAASVILDLDDYTVLV